LPINKTILTVTGISSTFHVAGSVVFLQRGPDPLDTFGGDCNIFKCALRGWSIGHFLPVTGHYQISDNLQPLGFGGGRVV
jgi:hypothetical protein